jgi:hypothetical protein
MLTHNVDPGRLPIRPVATEDESSESEEEDEVEIVVEGGIRPITNQLDQEKSPLAEVVEPRKKKKSKDKETPKKRIIISGKNYDVKWCGKKIICILRSASCNLWRPPRSSHCSECGHCIDTFDHHW